jgi:hypothetical protein
MVESPKPEAVAASESGPVVERRCDQCGERFDPQYHCFVCSVHATCACADDPE